MEPAHRTPVAAEAVCLRRAVPRAEEGLSALSSLLHLLGAEVMTADPANNVTENIFEKIGTNLHQ